jgi:hypothetical protein
MIMILIINNCKLRLPLLGNEIPLGITAAFARLRYSPCWTTVNKVSNKNYLNSQRLY